MDIFTLNAAKAYAEQLALGGKGLQETVETKVNEYLAENPIEVSVGNLSDNILSREYDITDNFLELTNETGFAKSDGTFTTDSWAHRIKATVKGLSAIRMRINNGLVDNTSIPFIVFCDKNNVLISSVAYESQKINEYYTYDVPLNAYYVYHNSYASKTSNCIIKAVNKKAVVEDEDLGSTLKKSIYGYENTLDDTEIPLQKLIKDGGYASIFHKWGFVGDSLSSGEHEYTKSDGSTGYVDLYDYSFGQCIARITNSTAINFSKGGATTKSILSDFGTKLFETTDNLCQAYVIYLGTNDKNASYDVGTVSTDVDTSDYNNNAETYAGYYGKIIQKIKEVQPKAKIFCVTIPNYGADESAYNTVIRDLVDIFDNCYLIDLYNYGMIQDSAWMEKYCCGWHLNAAGYLLYAWYVTSYVDYIIRHNWKDFEQVAFIGTDYIHE